MKGKSVMASIFEKMIQDFRKKDMAQLLDECMKLDAKKAKKIPLRYRLIAIGFVSHMTLDELDQKLKENGCEQLYARNQTEATLVYAFLKGLSYEEWLDLQKICEEMNNEAKDQWFNGAGVTYRELREYVRANSDITEDELLTQKVTRRLRGQIEKTSTGEEFLRFMEDNREDFCVVREKARYYFCKYLCYYIEEKTEAYLAARKSGFGQEQALLELNVLKCVAVLRKKFKDDQEIREAILDCGISFGNIYDAFNYFYFEYVSADWMEILMDGYHGDISSMTKADIEFLAHAIRTYEDGWDRLSDEEVIQKKAREMEELELIKDRQYVRAEAGKEKEHGYQKNRSGEKSVRNYMKGLTDLDRTTLICYLLFLGQESLQNKERIMTEKRLSQILLECGYAMLRENDDFDRFVIQYLQADDRTGFLIESVTAAAKEEKNFYLYHMYQGAVNANEKLKNLID